MEENKNPEMSVEELLEKLKASIESDDGPAGVSAEAENDLPEEPAALVSEEIAEKAEDAVSDMPEEPLAEEETVLPEEDAPAIRQINEEDILAAWGIERADLKKTIPPAETTAVHTETDDALRKPARTRVYYITRIEKKEVFAARKQSEVQKKTVDYDRTDCSLIKQALGMEKAPETDSPFEVDSSYEAEEPEAQKKSIGAPKDEYTYQRQSADIAAEYKREKRRSGLKLLFSAIAVLLLFVCECLPSLGVELPDVLNADYYPVVHAMLLLQLFWITAAFSYREIGNGFLSLSSFQMTSGSILALAVLFTTICDAVLCILHSSAQTYNFPIALCALFVRVFDYMDIKRQILSFEIVSAPAKKYVAVNMPENKIAGMVSGLEDYVGEDSLILRADKCSFVENYFARTEKSGDNTVRINKILVPALTAVALLSAVLSFVKGSGTAETISAFNAAVAIGFPVLLLLSASYPLYAAAKKLHRHDSTLIGETSVEEYAGTTMICFDDADAFPSYGVSLENLRIYGKGDIETIIEQMGAVFSKVGGPLRHVFTLMTADCPRPYKVKIEGVYNDGLCANVDGKTLFIGNASYMQANGYTVADQSDMIGEKHFSTMYLAQDGTLRAKFFIRYTLDGGFESMVKKLAHRGIASVILTADSNISDELLARSLDISKLPVKVVRRTGFENPIYGDRADSGIVSRGGVGDFVSTVTMCDRLYGVLNTLRAVRIASSVICAILMIFAGLLGMYGAVTALYIACYLLFWLIPAWLVTKFNL